MNAEGQVNEDDQALGQRLKTVRNNTGLTQVEFAAKLGCSHAAYGNYERGARPFPTSLARELSVLYGIDLFYLVVGFNRNDLEKRVGWSVNIKRLQNAILAVDERLEKRQIVLTSEKLALLYKFVHDADNVVDTRHLDELISLAG